MINLLQFPAQLFYDGGKDDAYEQYMKNDPTGINHVLDEMYGAVFNLEDADFEDSDPAFYIDTAYQLAIAIRLQNYPHRFLRLSDVVNFLVDFTDSEFCLVTWMAYALLGMRDDNSDDLKAFLAQFRKFVTEERPHSHTAQIISRLQTIVEREEKIGKVYDAFLSPQPPEAEEIKNLCFITDSLRYVSVGDVEYLLTHVVRFDVIQQLALLDVLREDGLFSADYDKLSQRIKDGEFVSMDVEPCPELPEASQEEQRAMRMECVNEMNLWKQKAEYYRAQCECYEQKERLASAIEGAVTLGKGIDSHLESMYEELKESTDKQREELDGKIKELEEELEEAQQMISDLKQDLAEMEDEELHKYSLSPEAFEILRKNSGCDFTMTLDETSGAIHSQRSPRTAKILAEMWNSLIDPSIINSANYPGAKKMMEIMLNMKEVYEAIDDKDEKALSRNLRKVDSVREQNEDLYQSQKEIKRLKLAGLQGAQNVTIINGNKVERSYGDNYNLEAGAKVVAQSSQQHPQLDSRQKPQWILNNVSSPQSR